MDKLSSLNEWTHQTDACFSRPLIAFEGARAPYLGPALGLKPHRNAAFALAVGLDAPIRLTLYRDRSASSSTTDGPIVCVPAGTLHRLEAEGMMAFLCLDAVGDDAAFLEISDILAADQVLLAESRDALRFWGLERWRTVLGVPTSEVIDPRAAAVARNIVKEPDAYTSLLEAARAAGLSPSRFQAYSADNSEYRFGATGFGGVRA